MTSFLILLYLSLIILISIITECPLSSHACHEEERMALLNFKSSLDDPANRLSTWQASFEHRNCCNWHGIKCSDESLHVISIDLRNTELEDYANDLTNFGSPPGYELEYLALNDNNLDGAFPTFILSMNYLSVLNLGNNNFEGILPTGLGSLGFLKILSLRSNKFNGSISEEILMNMRQLQILDLSVNYFSGPIPFNLGNLTSLTGTLAQTTGMFSVQYQLNIKGTTAQLDQMFIYNSGIDLSCNILDGNIPEEIGLLKGLAMLNLSHNVFSSNIPASFGNMSSLQSLDLSSNRLSGRIPQNLTSIDRLAFLNLSHNNLSDRIPRGNHFDTLSLDGSAFAGNDLLCGFPLVKVCDGDHFIDTSDTGPSSNVDEDDQEDGKEKFMLYAIVSVGFVVGFWGLFLVMLLKKQKWWFPYWKSLDSIAVRIVECFHRKQQ
ncbi:receptor-like protein 9DC3 isoform X2 [Papaver somniferum]|uniref:receptor-like protein 9DC3 isoform X2 n=1 Tax=Papaver somniferum TaxID=3469 RepID=UPI000E702B5E|nr:receptor-like protein 9DC3 isoform X2 [Papaver somniferum]